LEEHAERVAVRPSTRRRAFVRLPLDVPVLGVLVVGSVAALATAGTLFDSNRPWTFVVGFLVAAVLLAVLASAFVLSRESRTGRSKAERFILAWERPHGALLAFFSGCLLALPVLSLHSRVLAGDSDSGRLLASILYVQRNGFDRLIETQEVLLPHALLGPVVSLGGIPALQAFNVLSVVALTGVVAFLSWRVTGSSVAAWAAALALTALGSMLERAYKVPMYPTMLALGFLGVYLAYRAMAKKERRWLTALLAAICLVGSMEAHQVGQLFVVLSALLLVAVPGRAALAGLGRVYLLLGVLYIPRAVINLANGGVSHFFTNRIDYWTTKGYLLSIQVEFYDYPRELSLAEYLRLLPEGLFSAWGATGGLTLALGAASILVVPTRLRRFIVATTLFLLLVIVHHRLPFFSRYFSLLVVGSAIGAGVTIAALVGRGTFRSQTAAALAALGLVVANAFSYHSELDQLQAFKTGKLALSSRQLAQQVKPGEGVIGTRSSKIYNASTGARVYGGDFLTESEYVTFLTWPSDAEVIDLMRRYDAKWVFVPRNPDRWVTRYNNIWLRPAYGEEARYPSEVNSSPSFCLARRVHGAALYRLDPGGPRAADERGANLCRR
jgi:hypothetical protein